MKEKISYIFIILFIILGLNFIISNKSYASIAEGTVGTCNWEISDNGTFTIHEGDINGNSVYWFTKAPWNAYKDKIININITENVKLVGDASGFFSNFKNCENIDIKGLDTSEVTAMTGMFESSIIKTDLDLSNFNTSNVEYMSYMFEWSEILKVDLSSFDTKKVSNMREMFCGCTIEEVIINEFDNSNVTNMYSMFEGASISKFDFTKFYTPSVTDMGDMFRSSSFTNLDLSNFDTSNVTRMSWMFCDCSNLESINVSNWKNTKLLSMETMFSECSSLKNINLTNFNTSNVEWMDAMFEGCSSLESIDLSSFDTTNLIYSYCMFAECSSLKKLDLTNFNTLNLKSMYGMFAKCSKLEEIDLSSFDTSNVWNMEGLLVECNNLWKIKLGNKFDFYKSTNYLPNEDWIRESTGEVVNDLWNNYDPNTMADTYIINRLYAFLYDTGELHFQYGKTIDNTKGNLVKSYCIDSSEYWDDEDELITKVTSDKITCPENISWWFDDCTNLVSVNLSNFETSNVTDMEGLFFNCSSLTNLDLSNFDTSNVISMRSMFCSCSSLTNLDLSSFNTNQVINMCYMFYGCYSLKTIDLRSFDLSNVQYASSMFANYDEEKMWEEDDENYLSSLSWEEYIKLAKEKYCNVKESSLKTILVSDNWNLPSSAECYGMFLNLPNLVGGYGTKYEENYFNGEYAFADSETQKGYLTKNVLVKLNNLEQSTTDLTDNEAKIEYDGEINIKITPNTGYEIESIVDNGISKKINSKEEYIYELSDIEEYHEIEIKTAVIVNDKTFDETKINGMSNNQDVQATNGGVTLYNGGDATNGQNVNNSNSISSIISKVVNTGDKVLKVTIPIIILVLTLNYMQLRYQRLQNRRRKPRIGRK